MLINNFKILLSFIFIDLITGKLNFTTEYPGARVCQSGNLQIYSMHDPGTRWKDINNLISFNCTHLQGSLYIRGLNDINKNVLLDSIKEIEGHLIIEDNNVKKISLKNLVVIRGLFPKTHTLEKTSQSVKISLQITRNLQLENLDLKNLRSIINHDVLIDNNPRLRYLPHKINWTELFSSPSIQKVYPDISPDLTSQDKCSSDCVLWPYSNQSFCWGPSASQCQNRTLCESPQRCSTCYFEGATEKGCCNDMCTGGCSHFGPMDCHACKHRMDGNKCVETCPAGLERMVGGLTQKKDDFKYYAGSFCSHECPDNMLPQNELCVPHCSDGYFKNDSNHCIQCYGDKCQKDCDMMKMFSPAARDLFMNRTVLLSLKKCTKIRGYILINSNSFNQHNITVQDLYDNLGNLEHLEGGFVYSIDDHLSNLTFLSNLKTFRAANLHSAMPGLPKYYKFLITRTKLNFLGLKSLRNFTGGPLQMAANVNLCNTSLKWDEFVQPKSLINIRFANCTTAPKCDKECNSKGCWYSGNNWCYECANYDSGGTCVPSCLAIKGFYLSNATNNKSVTKPIHCDKCDVECASTCRGPTPADCIGGCVHKEENGVCVKSCSLTSYEENGTKKCLPCNVACAGKPGTNYCTGPSNKPGPGGCNKCTHLLIKRVLVPEISDYSDIVLNCATQCPSRTYKRVPLPSEPTRDLLMDYAYLCEPCSRLCSQCTHRTNRKGDCQICEGFWQKGLCVKSCSNDLSYGFTSMNNTRHCLLCNTACARGCTGPTKFNCIGCRHRKIYTNGTEFYCSKSCPKDKNIEELEERTGDFVCKAIWESALKLEEAKRTKTVVIVVLVLLVVIALVIALMFIFLRRKAGAERLQAKLKAVYSNLTEPNSKDENAFAAPPNMGRLLIISVEDLIFEDQTRPLGFGAFGYVYKGKWKVPKEDNMLIRKAAGDFYLPVAIKMVKNIAANQHEEIMQEAKIMSSVSHMNCLRFIGICLSSEVPCLVTAYVKDGSLDKYLVRNKSKITSFVMLRWSEQIADGMLYLTKRGIIHRDLAARNVLVSQLECVQITDFGLSKMLETTNEKEIVIKSGKVPIRWLAIETLLEGRYSSETDVWAYGVTLWEIFTFGKVPYEDQATLDISDFVLKGGRLPQPDICSLDVYIIMVNCWLESPNLRPDFDYLMRTFSSYSKNPGRYLSIQGDPFEIPSPSNIEMTNMNNQYFDRYNAIPGTAETTLPLLRDRNSMDGVLSDGTVLSTDEEDSRKLLPGSNEADLPTRTANRSSNLFKLFHDKSQSHGQNNNQNSVDSPGNSAHKLVPLASLEEPSFRGLSLEEEPRYVTDPSDKDIQLRQNRTNARVPSSQPSKFASYQPSHSSTAPLINDTDGYLEPIRSPNASHISVLSNDADGYLEPIRNPKLSKVPALNNDAEEYLEPISTKKKPSMDQDDYMVPSYNNTPHQSLLKTNSNNTPASRLSSVNKQSAKLPSVGEDRSPSNLYFPQNLVDDEYLEPQPQAALIKSKYP